MVLSYITNLRHLNLEIDDLALYGKATQAFQST